MTLPSTDGRLAEPNRFERHPAITGALIAAMILCLLDVLAGSVTHAREKRLLVRGLEIEHSYRLRHPVYHHDLRPNATVDSALWGSRFYRVRTNSLGFKDASTRVVSMEGRGPRVLLVGDSFTEGIGVEFDSTFAGHLASDAVRHGIEVVNAGVASYSPIIYWKKTEALIEQRGLHVDEVVVLVDISDIQDEANYYLDDSGHVQSRVPVGFIAPDVSTRADSAAPSFEFRVREFASTHSFALYRALSVAKNLLLRATRLGPAPLTATCAPPVTAQELACRRGWTSNPAIRKVYGTRGIANAREHMSRLAALLRAHRIPLTVVVYPYPSQLEWDYRHSLQSSIWRSWSAAEGARFVDLFPVFFAAVDSSSVRTVNRRYFIDRDVHWNERGGAFAEQQFLAAYCASEPHDVLAALCPPHGGAVPAKSDRPSRQ